VVDTRHRINTVDEITGHGLAFKNPGEGQGNSKTSDEDTEAVDIVYHRVEKLGY
jgi:hypothetical protein